MLIILEGPHGAGKTTLGGDLEKLLARDDSTSTVAREHRGIPTMHPLDEYLRPLTFYRPGGRTHLILDRWHWSERVFAPLRGRETQLDDAAWWAIEALLHRLGAVVVMVSQYHDVYAEVYQQRGEDPLQLEELPLVDSTYRSITQGDTLQYWETYNWQSPVNGNLHRIIRAARGREVATKELNPFTTYIGARWPRFLLFGDVREDLRDIVNLRSVEAAINLDPAFLPMPGTPGHFLLDSLAAARSTKLFGLANACDVDDPYRLWVTLGKPRVVALGRDAQAALHRTAVPCGAAPHPQDVLQHDVVTVQYGQLIARALTTQEDYTEWPTTLQGVPAGICTLRF